MLFYTLNRVLMNIYKARLQVWKELWWLFTSWPMFISCHMIVPTPTCFLSTACLVAQIFICHCNIQYTSIALVLWPTVSHSHTVRLHGLKKQHSEECGVELP